MMIVVTCGATLSNIAYEYRCWTGELLLFEKLRPGDARGEYGDYVLHVTPGQAQAIAHRYSSVIRTLNDATPVYEG